MNWFDGLTGRVKTDAPLSELTWFKLGGSARWLASPGSAEELCDIMRRAADGDLRLKVLGRGANVLVRDEGFDGVVVRLDDPAFTTTRVDGESVHVGGGVELMGLCHECARRGLSGLEAMAGIPGTVGGAVRMNAGGRHGSFGDVVEEVTLINQRGGIERLSGGELAFGYRSSRVGDRVVVSAKLGLIRSDRERTVGKFHRYWAEKKESQPLSDKSAGCIFKNPAGQSAGALIDRAGLKGCARGGASVSALHANFIVTRPGAVADDVLAVVEHVRETVARRCGVDLELEIDVW